MKVEVFCASIVMHKRIDLKGKGRGSFFCRKMVEDMGELIAAASPSLPIHLCDRRLLERYCYSLEEFERV